MDSFTDNHTVDLYIYDLTQGMARVMSQMILGEFWTEKLSQQTKLKNTKNCFQGEY